MNTIHHGLVAGLSNDDYHAGPGVSKSHLDAVSRSPLHYWAKYIDPNREPEEPTPAMQLGTATHSAILEPDLFTSDYIVVPKDAPRRPSVTQLNAKNPSAETLLAIDWWDDFNRHNAGKTILSAEDYQLCLQMRDAVHRHPAAAELLRYGVAEQAFYCTEPETGELIKCKPDWISDRGPLVDIKKTTDASPDGFARSVANYRYYVQAPFYLDIFEHLYGAAPEWFFFVAVEEAWPHAVAVYFVENDQLALGRDRYMKDLRTISSCKQSGNWPGYSEQVEPLKLPKWLNSNI